jgi:DNA (cytosine-5)-methyltransferase 1
MSLSAIDLFAGCGGMSEGLRQAGFRVIAAVEIDEHAAKTYEMNHPDTFMFQQDIRTLHTDEVTRLLDGEALHLLAGCPPCQGFSSIRRLNRRAPVHDERNDLLLEFLRFAEALQPLAVMLENVPGIVDYDLFSVLVERLSELGYDPQYETLDVANFEVPQRRKRLVLVGSSLRRLDVSRLQLAPRSVWDAIGELECVDRTTDPIHRIYPRHSSKVQEMISMIPKDGGSRHALPKERQLNCHKRGNVGFNDVYGRLRWGDVSSTITGGCLNPSKGRFLHPEEDRCITAREASLLQTFPRDYQFPLDIPKYALAQQIGNALPPRFCFFQARSIYDHIVGSYA